MKSYLMRQRKFLRKAGNEAVVWIDPLKVDHYAGSTKPVANQRLGDLKNRYPKVLVNCVSPFIKAQQPLVIPNFYFGRLQPIEWTQKYVRLLDFIEAEGDVTRTIWYRDLTADLEKRGETRYKRWKMLDESAVFHFFNGYISTLIQSMRDNGYDDPSGDFEPTGVIDANGQICKTGSGDHRFCIARILRLERFPLRIVGIHEDHFGSGHSPGAATYARALELIRDAGDRFA